MQSAFATPQRARTLRACLQSAADECSVAAPKPIAGVGFPIGGGGGQGSNGVRKYRRSGTWATGHETEGFVVAHQAPRNDAGQEILGILSRRQEPPPLFGSSPPARAVNPLINDRSFRQRPPFDATDGACWTSDRRAF